jgi:predicted nucleotide-binding protein (sugar kinase/HSP70/actin superfamily)
MPADSHEPRTIPVTNGTPKQSVEEIIRKRLEDERARLLEDMQVALPAVERVERPKERDFTRAEREHTTILFGGLTWKHEQLIRGALSGLGYKVEPLATPDVAAFQLGKEYGNNGQCNPTYFTVGNLVQHLQKLEAQGMSRRDIMDNHVFITAGACGPCRFGMYEAEYRLALRNSGFDGFRVMLFQQSGGLNQSEAGAGLEMNVDFFLAILNAMNMGDLVNDVGYQTRPFEIEEGATNAALDAAMDELEEVFRTREPYQLEGKGGALMKMTLGSKADMVGKFLDQLRGDHYIDAFAGVAEKLDTVEIDRTRVKPLVKITGEFWAQTTEGDGNFNMFRFLEREGAQVLVEPVGTWIMYMIHQAKQMNTDRAGVTEDEAMPAAWRVDKRMATAWTANKKNLKLSVAEAIFKREWNRLRDALGGIPHELTDQYELQRLGHPLYNSRAGGGEGHLEVAKNIYYSNKDMCHMVLSLKPFGCMPSTQSDGVQSAVVNLYKDIIYLPIETSGEGEINAHSRVQMALGEAKVKAKQEIDRVQEETGVSLDEARDYADEHPELKRPLYKVPHFTGTIGTAANFLRHVAELKAAEANGSRKRVAVGATH